MKFNPASKTYYQYENWKIQHYCKDIYTCNSCGAFFRPKIHSQSLMKQMVVGMATIITVCIVLFYAPFLTFPMILLLLLYTFLYRQKKRKMTSSAISKTPRYGEIIGECTQCGSHDIKKKTKTKS